MKKMSRFLLMPNEQKDPAYLVTGQIIDRLTARGGTVILSDTHRQKLQRTDCCFTTEIPGDADCLIVVGGDGSVLDAAVIAMACGLPVVGVNLGRLGYLTELEVEDIPLLDRLLLGDYRTDSRMTLEFEILAPGRAPQHSDRLALNEIAITHENNFGIADLTLTDNSGNHIRYRADGLLLSTPSGSTAYSFSAGGPVVDPSLNVVCVTPICPHSFFNRSMVLDPDTEITVTNTTTHGDRLLVCVDGRTTYELQAGDKIRVTSAKERFSMIAFGNNPTFTTLRRKMELAELKD